MNKKRNKLAALGCVACTALAVLLSPAASVPAHAAAAQETSVMPMSDVLTWRFKIEGNKLYRRLYNYSIGVWIGEWEFVKYITPKN